jgi:beta-lactam-binding protein with PASTA domain
VTLECGLSEYTEQGATATDTCVGDLTAEIVTVGTVDAAVLGDYTITYDVSDPSGNAAVQVTRIVTVVDTTVPVITLTGDAAVTVECGATYTDEGATALDACAGDLTANIVTVGAVDTAVLGEYTITFNVTDGNGNNAVEVVRTVTVADTTAPVITLLGEATLTLNCGETYTDAGATASDTCAGDLTAAIVTVNPVDTAKLGVYTVTYNVTDGTNAAAQVVRLVTVSGTEPPVITLTGDEEVTVECGATYTDAGATAMDSCEGDLTANIVVVNPVNAAAVGVYTVTYNVVDANNAAALEVTRVVTVVDTTAPVITLTGDAAVTVECGATYTDAGATALDACAGSRTAEITTVNPVNAAVLGAYTVTYNVNDGNGNNAAQVTRVVTVVDTTAPVITLTGDAAVTVACGGTYTDAGATALDACVGDRTAEIVTVNPVNPAVIAVYTVTYNVNDGNGNNAAQVTRTVTVSDTTAPVITLVGDDEVTVECAATYTDAGATALDTCSGDRTGGIVTVNPVNPAVVGVYTVTYNVNDGNGNNAAEVTRIVTVSDTTIPVITLLGDAAVTIDRDDTYTDAGATALDTCAGDLTANIVTVNTVDTTALGTYTVTYNVSDPSGNNAVEVTRTVTVVIPMVTVPNVVNQTQTAATAAITGAELVVGTITQVYSATVALGSVVNQTPAAGTSVEAGSAVALEVSKGPQPVKVPNVVGSTQSAASTAITTAGLTVGAITQVFSATVPTGTVVSQTPVADTSVAPGTAVALNVSKGPESVKVPNVAGTTQAAASGALTAAGLTTGAITQAFNATVPSGSVIGQTPAAGTSVAPGTAVALIISKGPATQADLAALLSTSFATIDTNGDGKISFAEASAALPGLTQEAFDALDTNGSGSIGEVEAGIEEGCGCTDGKGAFSVDSLKDMLGNLFLGGLSLVTMLAFGKRRF